MTFYHHGILVVLLTTPFNLVVFLALSTRANESSSDGKDP